MSRQQHLKTAAVVLAALAAACDELPTLPRVGTLNISVETSGGDLDIDGYQLVVDSVRQGLFANATGVFRNVTAGTHTLELTDVADNCTVRGGAMRSVSVRPNEVVNVSFAVACVATGVEITIHTTGVDNPPSFEVLLNDDQAAIVAPNEVLLVTRLQAGTHVLSLRTRAENCSLVGGPKTVTVTSHTITPVQLEVSCVALVRAEKIAFVTDSTVDGVRGTWIELVKPDGSATTALAFGNSPAWSPDGTKLLFSTSVCGFYDADYGIGCKGELVLMDPETWSMTTIRDGSSGFHPSWSPAGDAVAFTRCCEYADQNRLYVARFDGSPAVRLLVPNVTAVSDAAWSPDGKRIAFTCSTGLWKDVCVIDRDGTSFVRLTAASSLLSSGPAWSPDGSRIAFTIEGSSGPPAEPRRIAMISAEGGEVIQLTTGFNPSWLRDGKTIVFAGGDGLFTVSTVGLLRTRLTTGAHYAPAWRP